MTVRYAKHVNKRATRQTEAIPGDTKQVKNNAGGYVYAVDKWMRLQRFLILGTDGGTFYVKERALTRENAAVVEACLAEDAGLTIETIVSVSDAGRAPKNDQAIFALALAASTQNPDAKGLASSAIRLRALAALPRVCRIPTHLFHFVEYVKALRGFGRGLRRAIQDWYARWTPDQMAYEVVKYQQRDGWSHRDVLRQVHPKLSAEHQAVLRWAVGAASDSPRLVSRKSQGHKKDNGVTYGPAAAALPGIISAFEEAKTASAPRLIQLIRTSNLSREMLPTEALNRVDVWEALLENMPYTAMLRNLGKMSSIGLVASGSKASKTVAARLADTSQLRKSRVHPMAVLNALRVYRAGHGDKGKLTWKTVANVADALDAAFYESFGNVTPTGKSLMLALDVSGSMSAHIAGTGLTCREAAAAMALITANVEPNHFFVGFCAATGRSSWGRRDVVTELPISPRQRLDDVVAHISNLPFGGTDCALPMIHATEKKLDVDSFLVFTDSETWAGGIHPNQALRRYREKLNKPGASSVVVGMTATEFTIADPKDPLMLDVVGFDTATPQAISTFIGQ